MNSKPPKRIKMTYKHPPAAERFVNSSSSSSFSIRYEKFLPWIMYFIKIGIDNIELFSAAKVAIRGVTAKFSMLKKIKKHLFIEKFTL